MTRQEEKESPAGNRQGRSFGKAMLLFRSPHLQPQSREKKTCDDQSGVYNVEKGSVIHAGLHPVNQEFQERQRSGNVPGPSDHPPLPNRENAGGNHRGVGKNRQNYLA